MNHRIRLHDILDEITDNKDMEIKKKFNLTLEDSDMGVLQGCESAIDQANGWPGADRNLSKLIEKIRKAENI